MPRGLATGVRTAALDRSPVRSIRYRPGWNLWLYGIFIVNFLVLGYLGVQPPSPSQVHTNTYGMAYGRETLGLRVAGVAAERKAAMVAEAHRIEDEFGQGRLLWDRSEFNCADVVVRILHAGGYDRSPPLGRQWLPVMPLDIFEEARQACEEDASLRMELVAYRQVPGAHAVYRFSRFPLSLGQPLRSVARALREAPREPLEAAATKQLTGYFGDHQLCECRALRDGSRCCDLSEADGGAAPPRAPWHGGRRGRLRRHRRKFCKECPGKRPSQCRGLP